MAMSLKILAVAGVLGAVVLAWYVDITRQLTRDFGTRRRFDGELISCLVFFPSNEGRTDCLVGANDEGLYLSSSQAAQERNRWWRPGRRYRVLKTPIFIPWSRLTWANAKFPLRGDLRFTVTRSRLCFFLPRENCEALRVQARCQAGAAGNKALAR